MGMKAVRAARKNHPMPGTTSPHAKQADISGYWDTKNVNKSVLPTKEEPHAPKKSRPFESTHGDSDTPRWTPPPISAEEPVRGEHAKKLSRTSRTNEKFN